MRIVIQRCVKASVEVAGETVGSIGQGLMALIGIERNDTWIECEYCLRRLINGRYFDADPVLSEATRASGTREQVATKAWAKSVKDMDLEILIVSQFTLYGRLTKGSKPDFHKAMKAPQSEEMFNKCVQWVKDNYKPEKVQTGAFGRYMQVSLTNDGPVTIVLEQSAPEESTP
ncbi:D-tyrosyl-tRNA(Tyr) deacylase [Gregarina niphandrodes]|uniref:D-aminoacyl-tRNA deacylase n=1 Tax=Gregarina niphandrodes TaxID=110365 RepID=A0A023B2Y6_GRENI|nr:D-tyrosyl-tRNA(Tyr) deacylase [Gregarina niphandrodes]EZG55285.1 D-tyrosyl-tRNA(Tyr) deacylase [Gregarina niphandrodes]|eukprot:XP_011131664.1 D-tyrosyl-tRNA(Tyr) deacylase [Gregarina niphandrodes]